MTVVSINEPELSYIELIRVALSEENNEQRLRAISNVRHEVIAARLEKLAALDTTETLKDKRAQEFFSGMARREGERTTAAHEFANTLNQYERKRERKLNVAEHIATLILLSIQDGKFEGVHTVNGILSRVSHDAKAFRVSGARDNDTLRKIWKTYRGVAHLGVAMNHCEDNPDKGENVLHVAERIRSVLSENCPRGTRKPYVSCIDQISFVYISNIYGPRFLDRGLPYG